MANPQIVKYRGMIRVEQEYAKSGMTDSEFAAHMSSADVKYSRSQITQWRTALGIPNNEPMSAREKAMQLQLTEMKALWLVVRHRISEEVAQELTLNFPNAWAMLNHYAGTEV